jgi:hypothetical protein
VNAVRAQIYRSDGVVTGHSSGRRFVAPVSRPGRSGRGHTHGPRWRTGYQIAWKRPLLPPPSGVPQGVNTMSYEFTRDQNELIGGLAGKMRLVGLVAVIIGLLNFVAALILLVFVFQDKLPSNLAEKIPDDVKKELAPNTYMWMVAVQQALAGLIFLMVGIWTRSAAASFQNVVATAGKDVSHLMNALGSLRKMYSLIYTLILAIILAMLLAVGLQLYLRYGT